MKNRETWDDRYGLLNHKYLHYGVVTPGVNWTAGVSGAECVILGTAGITMTLPDAAVFRHAAFYVKNTGIPNLTIATTAGQLIDGAAPTPLATNDSALFVSDGFGWWILAHNP